MGVILLELFDLSYCFGATDGKIELFWHNKLWKSLKLWLGSKSFRSMTLTKVRILRPNKVIFWVPPNKKDDFLKKPQIK